jgi:hypothetical protein
MASGQGASLARGLARGRDKLQPDAGRAAGET